MATSSKSRSNSPVLPLNFSFPRSISPPRRQFSQSSFSSSSSSQFSDSFSSSYISSNFASSSSSSLSSSIFDRPSSPTRVNLSPTSSVPSFRISLNRSHSPNSRVSIRDQVVSKPASIKKTCMCSPTNHPGSFRCSIHRNGRANNRNNSQSISCSPSRLNLRRSAMTNSLVRIGTVEGDWVKRALTALIRPSSHQQRRRFDFQHRPSRLSIMSY
ncbi:uncharacterized protein LOC130804056 [Amaranthus tricolor]|uniref:uncharacterized protein LOC130804056 n=1 Tax=Amaranthus tricolor TaxID=29722 RepID=UPI0025847083|nr:uncharacterized protein LOC130804056 [Amaranthus tricolor]XP_057524347.1 uncharacterized protein LOC130804056 [Amaranthus tricolor]